MQLTTYHQTMTWALVWGLCLVLAGCDLLSLEDRPSEIRELINQNLAEWNENDVQSYQFTYNRTVGDTETNDVWVLLQGGRIDTASVEGEGVDNPDDFLTIDRLYDEIIENFERDDRGNFQVNFDQELSYPQRYRMLPGESTEGRGVVVTEFELLE